MAAPTHMTQPCSIDPGSSRGADVLAIAFGTAVAMWVIGYVTHIPMLETKPWLVFVLLVAVQIASGFVTGRYTGRGYRVAAGAAVLTMLINVLILGSLKDELSDHNPLLWVPGYALVSIALMLVGHAIGKARRIEANVNWSMGLALSAFAATALVVIAGGLVTGFDAGFSVPDWPSTFEMNMFVYPLSKMTGGIYYEHTHRLVGALVGLNALVLVIYLWRAESRRSVKWFATGMFVLVCVQGVVGGIWVTKVDPADTEAMATAIKQADGTFRAAPKLAYVLVHGTLGQLILAGFAVLAVTQHRVWRDCSIMTTEHSASTDRVAALLAFVGLMAQLMIGVYLRKEGDGLLLHITMAVVVSATVMAVAARAMWVRGEKFPVLRKLGVATMIVLGLQLLLGIAALIARETNHGPVVTVGSDATSSATDAIITTLHQSTGAALLALVAALGAWVSRLLKVPALPPAQAPKPSAAPAN